MFPEPCPYEIEGAEPAVAGPSRPTRRARARALTRAAAPSLITFVGLGAGVTATIAARSGAPVETLGWLLAAGLADNLDGRLARALDAASSFGRWLDSVADLVAAGIAPALLLYALLVPVDDTLAATVSVFWISATAFRLVRFTIASGSSDLSRFVGLPAPLAAAILVVGACLVGPIPLAVLAVTLGAAMLSRIPVPSLKDVGPGGVRARARARRRG